MSRVSTYRQEGGAFGARVTTFALALALGLVLARCMMQEGLHEPPPLPGQEILLRSPGAMATTVLDLLSFLPAVLVAGRALFDERFKLRWPMSVGVLALLAIWAIVSMAWAADRYAAAVSAGKLLGGAAIAWAVVQCVRDWRTFRIIAACAGGLLAVLLAHSLYYDLAELPDTRKAFEENRAQILAQQGIEEGTFAARQFAQKVMAGELMGFYGSPNSLAAVAAMVGVIVAGLLWQRYRDGAQAAWYLPGALLLVGVGWIVWRTQSNTAAITPVLGMALLVMGWRLRGWMAGRRKMVFAAGVGVFVLGWAAVIGHGLYHGSLVTRTLTFRWHYWVGAAAMAKAHALLGVGWHNFSEYYLQYRLPAAPEEVRDPHNLFVRFAAELGAVGLVLGVGWLLRTAWEITRPALPTVEDAPQWEAPQEPLKAVSPLMGIAVIATVVTTVVAIDFGQDPMHVLTEMMRRAMYGLLLVGTAVVLTAADLQHPRLERRSAEVLLLAVTCGLVVFLLHNCIDFSIFETGLFYLFVTLASAAVAMRLGEPKGEGRGALVMLLGFVAMAIGFAVVVVAPVVQGGLAARRGDELLVAQKPMLATREYAQAYEGTAWLHNAQYLLRQARAQIAAGDRPANLLATEERAIVANPRSIQARLARASVLATMNQGDAVVAELEQVYWLNPNDIGIRLDAAEMLARLGRAELSVEQYRAALVNNSQLPENEPKRLSAEKIAEIEGRITALSGK